MDIPELKAFLAVSQARSFSKAAALLDMSQPAISRRIQSLEAALDQKLFDRDGHSIHLTAAGHMLLSKAEAITVLVAETESEIKNIGDEIQGPLSLAISHHCAEHYLAAPLALFSKQYPKVQLSFQFLKSEAACKYVVQGNADLGIVTLPPQDELPKLLKIPLYQEELCLVVANDHELTKQPIRTIFDELGKHQALLPPLKSYTGRLIESHLSEKNIQMPKIIECGAFTSLKTLLVSGLGWGILPKKLMHPALKIMNTSPDISINRHLGLVIHDNRQLSPAASAFSELLQEFLQPLQEA